MAQSIITNWEPKHSALYGKHIVHLQHRLHESPLFSDDALADLIDRVPRQFYHVNTMNTDRHAPGTWREGDFAGASGREVMDAVRNGNIWVLIQQVAELDPAYREVLDQLYGEFEHHVPGLETFKRKMSILISSPKVQVYYHCDIPGQSLWQLRGTKRVYMYPNSAPFLHPEAMEKIVLNEADEQDTPYEAWFDDYAEIVDLNAGEMLHWPIHSPHRVVNGDCVNVSFTTEHWTTPLCNHYANVYANGILRRNLGINPSITPSGPALWAKLAIAGMHRQLGFRKKNKMAFKIDFRVDPQAPGGFSDIDAFELAK